MSFSNLHKDATFMPSHAPSELHWPRAVAICYFPKGPCGMTTALPSLGRFSILFLLIGKKPPQTPYTLSQCGKAMSRNVSRSIKLTPASVPSNNQILLQ